MSVRVEHGDCRDVIKTLADNSIDSVVTDPPYSLVSIQKRFGRPGQAPAKFGKDGLYQRASSGFMGQAWDTGETAFDRAWWAEVLRAMKPGAHLVAFSGTRTYHRMACAIEDAGFEIRDQIAWCYGSGFPKSHDVAKGIDKAAGAERRVVGRKSDPRYRSPADAASGSPMGNISPRKNAAANYARAGFVTSPATNEAAEWEGWGTALKPAWESICLARKPLSESTIAANVLKWGTGAINVDGCRVEGPPRSTHASGNVRTRNGGQTMNEGFAVGEYPTAAARWPANLCHDGSEEVVAAFPQTESGLPGNIRPTPSTENCYGEYKARSLVGHIDSGSAARFFYAAKADKDDRWGSKHPTVKPIDLMRWLARLVTPPKGTVLDPFAGSGTTGAACLAEGFGCILIEREDAYVADIRERLAFLSGEGRHSLSSKNRHRRADKPTGGFFDTEPA